MKNIKKLLSLLLCGIMLFGMFPASLFAADGDTGDGSGTISETFVPKITWKRTFEYEHRHDTPANQHADLGGLHAGENPVILRQSLHHLPVFIRTNSNGLGLQLVLR